MKNLFFLLLIFLFFQNFALDTKSVKYSHVIADSFPITQNLGSGVTLVNSPGAVRTKLVNQRFTDTTAANLTQIKYYPGAQIFTTNDNSLWLRNSAATKWLRQTGGGNSDNLPSVVNYIDATHFSICNVNSCDTITTTINPQIITILSDTSIRVCDFSGACETIIINPTPLIPSGKFIDTAYSTPGVKTDTLITSKNGDTTRVKVYDRNCGLIDGGIVTYDSLLIFGISPAIYILCSDGVRRTSVQTNITLDPADATFNRFDAIVLDSTGVNKVTGDPSSDPVQPQINPDQILLTYILVAAGDTTPPEIVNCTTPDITIYDENTGSPEWSHTSTISANFGNTVTPYHLTKDIGIGTWVGGENIILTTPTPVTIRSYTYLKFAIRSEFVMQATNQFQLSWVTATGSASVNVSDGLYGFNRQATGAYQIITVPISDFTTISPAVALALQVPSTVSLKITFNGKNTHGILIDYIQLGGSCIEQPTPPLPTTAQGKVYATITVGAYNAKDTNPLHYDYMCDGVNDDVQINAAIAALPTGVAGRVLLSEGRFNTSASVLLNQANIVLEGNGNNTVIALQNATNVNVIELGDGSGSVRGMKIKNISIDGNMANQTTESNGIYIKADADASIVEYSTIKDTRNDNVFVANGANSVSIRYNVLDGTKTSVGGSNIQVSGDSVVIERNFLTNNNNNGVRLNFGADYGSISYNTMENSTANFISIAGYYVTVDNNIINIQDAFVGDYAIAVDKFTVVEKNTINVGNVGSILGNGNGVIQVYSKSNSVINNTIYFTNTTTEHWGIVIENVGSNEGKNIITGNNIINLANISQHASSTGIQLAGVGNICSDNHITGMSKGITDYQGEGFNNFAINNNAFYRCDYPVIFTGGSGTSISNNIFKDCITAIKKTGNGASTNLTITGNNVDSAKQEGFILRSVQNSTVSGNTIKNSGTQTDDTYAAILLTTVSGTNYSMNNTLQGNTISGTLSNKHKYGIRENSSNDGPNIITNNNILNAVTTNISTQNTTSDVSHNVTGTTGIERHYPVTTKGDLMVGNATGNVIRVAVGTDTWVLTADATQAGGVKWAAASGGITTADNGLTANTSSNVQLGGTLLQNTTIATGANTLTISTSTALVNPLRVTSTTGIAVYASATTTSGVLSQTTSGTSLEGQSTSGYGLAALSTSGIAGNFVITPTSPSTVQTVLQIARQEATTAADGIGGSIDLQVYTTASLRLSNQIISKFTTASDATRTSSLVFTGLLSAATVNLLTLAGDGSMTMRPITATAASAITPAEAMLVFVSNTNGTFTSIGLWCYENGAWAKK